MDLHIGVEKWPDGAKVAVAGEVDVSNADELRRALADVFEGGFDGVVEVDMSDVPYIDSTGIGVLVGAAHQACDCGARLSVTGAQANVVRIMGLLGVDEVVDVKAK